MPPSQHVDVFNDSCNSGTCMEASSNQHVQSLIQSLLPLPFPEDGWVRWIVPSF